MSFPVIYEYAGFKYIIDVDYDYGLWFAHPMSGQPKAAHKEKHRKAAIDCYIKENYK